jgi:hypothetical protein
VAEIRQTPSSPVRIDFIKTILIDVSGDEWKWLSGMMEPLE